MSIVSTFFPHKFRLNYLLIFTFLYKRILHCSSLIIHSYHIEMFWNKYDVNYWSDGRVQRTWNLRKWYLPHVSIFHECFYTLPLQVTCTLVYSNNLNHNYSNLFIKTYPIKWITNCLFVYAFVGLFFFQFYAVGFNHIHNSIIRLLSNV